MISITNSFDRITINYFRLFHNNHIITHTGESTKSENFEFHIKRDLYLVAILCQSIWAADGEVSIRCNEQIQAFILVITI